MFRHQRPLTLPTAEEALPGRIEPCDIPPYHLVNRQPLAPPYPPHLQRALLAMGCFWGVERRFWQRPGVVITMVGYAGGHTPNPTYEEVCSGATGHTEVVQILFDPAQVSYRQLLQIFWEGHDPTQGMQQGNDIGTQYRSAIYGCDATQLATAEATRHDYQQALTAAGFGTITTEIAAAPPFYYAEGYHQQYLARHPNGYCGVGGLGIALPAATA